MLYARGSKKTLAAGWRCNLCVDFHPWLGLCLTGQVINVKVEYPIGTSTTDAGALAAAVMTFSNGNTSRVTGPLCGKLTGHRWIPHTKASDAELWCFLWSAPEQSWGWWFEIPSCSVCRHCHATIQTSAVTVYTLYNPEQKVNRIF